MEKETRKNFSKNGFSLIETLVALSILSIALIGPMSLATNSISNAMISHNQLVAFYLAQEAMEFVINFRDSNYDDGSSSWLSSLNNCISQNGCYVDVVHNTIDEASLSSPSPLIYSYNSVDEYGYYNHNSLVGDNTIFYRTVKITNPVYYSENPESNEAKVEVKVWWDDKMGLKEITLEENIFNWNQ